MGPEALAQVLQPLATLFPTAEYPDLLVGLDGADDAAVYRLRDDEAIIVTTDFFPPVVDDPYDFGAIAAANAMSDVFAMGGEVLVALNLAMVPEDLDPSVTAEIVRGGAEKVREAGGVVAGGHTVIDREPKYGLAVVGRVHPRDVLRKSGARPGDVLLLTKPLGTGLVTTALKQGKAAAGHVAAAVASMGRLNRAAARVAVADGVTAATDVTGFGLVGHGLELAEQSGVGLRIEVDALPLLPGVHDYAAAGCAPGGTFRNRDAFAALVRGQRGSEPAWTDILNDPQTSGGLLMAVPADAAGKLVLALSARDVAARAVGSVIEGRGIELV